MSQATTAIVDTQPVNLTAEDLLLHFQVEQFLSYEASLLDARRFHEWFDLLADDLEYWMPVRTTRMLSESHQEFAKIGESAFFDETKPLFHKRILKLDTGFSWSEEPPSRTRHVFTNLRVLETSGDEVRTSCNFSVYRSRNASDEDFWCGRREDTVRRVGGGWELVKRHLFLDQVSLLSPNLSIFF